MYRDGTRRARARVCVYVVRAKKSAGFFRSREERLSRAKSPLGWVETRPSMREMGYRASIVLSRTWPRHIPAFSPPFVKARTIEEFADTRQREWLDKGSTRSSNRS